MPGTVEQTKYAKHRRPNKILVASVAVGIYSILAAIISIHFFGFLLFPYIMMVSAAGFLVSLAIYSRSADEKFLGLKKTYMESFQVMGDVFGRLILVVLYYTVFLIPGIFVAAFEDRLQTKKKPSQWQERTDQEYTLERAKEQW